MKHCTASQNKRTQGADLEDNEFIMEWAITEEIALQNSGTRSDCCGWTVTEIWPARLHCIRGVVDPKHGPSAIEALAHPISSARQFLKSSKESRSSNSLVALVSRQRRDGYSNPKKKSSNVVLQYSIGVTEDKSFDKHPVIGDYQQHYVLPAKTLHSCTYFQFLPRNAELARMLH